MIGQVREKDQNKIRSNNRERDARSEHGLIILQLMGRIYSPRTEDADKKPSLQGRWRFPHFLQKLAGSSIGFVFEHRLDLVAQLGRIFVPVG